MNWQGKQYFHCPNCGGKQYGGQLNNNHVKSLMCSYQCLNEWELKYARMILGKSADDPPDAGALCAKPEEVSPNGDDAKHD